MPYFKLKEINKFIFTCAICWKYILIFIKKILIKFYYKKIVKIYNKTIYVSVYSLIIFIRKIILLTIGLILWQVKPYIVKYYYKIYNQQITKIINLCFYFCVLKNIKIYLILFYNRVLSLLKIIDYIIFYIKLNLLLSTFI